MRIARRWAALASAVKPASTSKGEKDKRAVAGSGKRFRQSRSAPKWCAWRTVSIGMAEVTTATPDDRGLERCAVATPANDGVIRTVHATCQRVEAATGNRGATRATGSTDRAGFLPRQQRISM